ncbi:MAG TPA: hypothetical protein VHI51_17195 [Ktedonobacterales bacterium]|nr:hypothetical protein [Ktedonobacterales bacterium]
MPRLFTLCKSHKYALSAVLLLSHIGVTPRQTTSTTGALSVQRQATQAPCYNPPVAQ